jgi:hypothetical protein
MMPLRRGRGWFALGRETFDAVARLRLNQDPMSDSNFFPSGQSRISTRNGCDRFLDRWAV